MPKNIVYVLLYFFFFCGLKGCQNLELKIAVPACIEDKIKAIQKNEVYSPPAQVWQWQVDGQTYYYFTANCCDQFNYLLDSNCKTICAPDGGITGGGDGNCPVFTEQITKVLIWEDNRN